MEVLAAVFIAMIVSLFFVYALNARGPWGSLWSFFLLVVLIVWAASLWISPFGPVYWGVSWGPLVFVALIFAALLASIPASRTARRRKGDVPDRNTRQAADSDEAEAAAGALGFMFWVLIGLLLVGIIVGYTADLPVFASQ